MTVKSLISRCYLHAIKVVPWVRWSISQCCIVCELQLAVPAPMHAVHVTDRRAQPRALVLQNCDCMHAAAGHAEPHVLEERNIEGEHPQPDGHVCSSSSVCNSQELHFRRSCELVLFLESSLLNLRVQESSRNACAM